jgi:hypothetical protein
MPTEVRGITQSAGDAAFVSRLRRPSLDPVQSRVGQLGARDLPEDRQNP